MHYLRNTSFFAIMISVTKTNSIVCNMCLFNEGKFEKSSFKFVLLKLALHQMYEIIKYILY